jgi:hypothetical protein
MNWNRFPRWAAVTLAAVSLVACHGGERGAPRQPPQNSSATPGEPLAKVRVVKITRTDARLEKPLPVTLSFDVLLERPDLGLAEPNKPALDSEGPAPLRTRLLYLSKKDDLRPDGGITLCERPTVPHRCEHQLSHEETSQERLDYILKITFEDDTYAVVPITVEVPAGLPLPEIATPTTTPAQGDQLLLAFANIPAEQFLIEVNLCHPYKNDGINPCLDGDRYELRGEGGLLALVGTARPGTSVSVAPNAITLKSLLSLRFQESVRYSIEAHHVEKKGDVEVETISKIEQSYMR